MIKLYFFFFFWDWKSVCCHSRKPLVQPTEAGTRANSYPETESISWQKKLQAHTPLSPTASDKSVLAVVIDLLSEQPIRRLEPLTHQMERGLYSAGIESERVGGFGCIHMCVRVCVFIPLSLSLSPLLSFALYPLFSSIVPQGVIKLL